MIEYTVNLKWVRVPYSLEKSASVEAYSKFPSMIDMKAFINIILANRVSIIK